MNEAWPRIQKFTNEELNRLHQASMEILRDVGVAFHEQEALEIFQKHGTKVEGKTAFLNEHMVTKALETVPSEFTITARNTENNIKIGGENVVLAPGYGAPYMVTETGEQREAIMEDYNNFCKLVQTSEILDLNGFMMVQPSDVAVETSHLDMLLSNMTLCDKVFMGSPLSREAVQDCIEMAGIVWGVVDKPVMISTISILSPLQFSREMAMALIEFASCGQPIILRGGGILGLSTPVKLGGLLALQNAENLAGITLAQLVNPGTPVVYSTGSYPADMTTGSAATGAPEHPMALSAGLQMAKFYKIPSRGSGAQTDAHFPDMQAGIESTLVLHTAMMNGANFIFSACGILGSSLAMSYEKFLADEELCGMLKRILKTIDLSNEAIDLKSIKEVGIGGEYLTHPKTLKYFKKELFIPGLMNRQDYDSWNWAGKKRLDEIARQLFYKRLEAYEKPEIDPKIERDLLQYVAKKKS